MAFTIVFTNRAQKHNQCSNHSNSKMLKADIGLKNLQEIMLCQKCVTKIQ